MEVLLGLKTYGIFVVVQRVSQEYCSAVKKAVREFETWKQNLLSENKAKFKLAISVVPLSDCASGSVKGLTYEPVVVSQHGTAGSALYVAQ